MNKNNGFTLIELVLVIGILAILAVFVLATLNPLEQFKKARDAQRKSDLGQIQKALEQYYQDHGRYPASSTTGLITDYNGNAITWGGPTGWAPYMNVVPADPDSQRTYVYYSSSADSYQSYRLYASLERGTSDPQTCTATSTQCIQNPTSVAYCNCPGANTIGANCGTNGGSYPCNYGVTSPNITP